MLYMCITIYVFIYSFILYIYIYITLYIYVCVLYLILCDVGKTIMNHSFGNGLNPTYGNSGLGGLRHVLPTSKYCTSYV